MTPQQQAQNDLVAAVKAWEEDGTSWYNTPDRYKRKHAVFDAARAFVLSLEKTEAAADKEAEGLPMLSHAELLQRIELGIAANGGETWHGSACRCEPEVNNFPCEYCATWEALRVAKLFAAQVAQLTRERDSTQKRFEAIAELSADRGVALEVLKEDLAAARNELQLSHDLAEGFLGLNNDLIARIGQIKELAQPIADNKLIGQAFRNAAEIVSLCDGASTEVVE